MSALFRDSNVRLSSITSAFIRLKLQHAESSFIPRQPLQLRSITQKRSSLRKSLIGVDLSTTPCDNNDDNDLSSPKLTNDSNDTTPGITSLPLPVQTYGTRMKSRTPAREKQPRYRWSEDDDNELFRLVKEDKSVHHIYANHFPYGTFAAVAMRAIYARRIARVQDRQVREGVREGTAVGLGNKVGVEGDGDGKEAAPLRDVYRTLRTTIRSERQANNKADDSIYHRVISAKPKPPRGQWTTEEDAMLGLLVKKYNHIPEPTLWSSVAGGRIDGSLLLRNATACRRRWRALMPPQSDRVGPWTVDEERRFQEAIWEQLEGKYQVAVDVLVGKPATTKHNLAAWRPNLVQVPGQEGLPILKIGSRRLRMLSWLKIAERVGSRSDTSCQPHFYDVYNNADKGAWTPKELELAKEALEMYGKDYRKVAEHIGTRSPRQVARVVKVVSHLRKRKNIDWAKSNNGDKK
ncbi:MAG: hypothetical protein J3R72DRAFT_488090 [Linnemannia gamsii]|nr:MAG: hypothetical protein J3R72DRAFT_488090 [Linnemannia gamsii]